MDDRTYASGESLCASAGDAAIGILRAMLPHLQPSMVALVQPLLEQHARGLRLQRAAIYDREAA